MDEKAKKEVERIAHLNWINRGQPKGDPMTDWKAASEYVVNGDPKLLHEKTRAALTSSDSKSSDAQQQARPDTGTAPLKVRLRRQRTK